MAAAMNAIEDALLAVMAAKVGDEAAARGHITRAQHHARASARRARQIVEIASLVVAERAAGLTLEHVAEFPDDAALVVRLGASTTTERISAESAAEQRRGPGLST
jgi:hypothetical protein